MLSVWRFLLIVQYVHLSPAKKKFGVLVPEMVDEAIILGSQFDQKFIDAISSAQPTFRMTRRANYYILRWRFGRMAIVARNGSLDDWNVFTPGFTSEAAVFNHSAFSIRPLNESMNRSTDLAAPLKIVRKLYDERSDNTPMEYQGMLKTFKIVHLFITGDDPISSEAESEAKKLRNTDTWIFVVSERGQQDELVKLTGLHHLDRLKVGVTDANAISEHLRLFEVGWNFSRYVCEEVESCKYINKKQAKCIKARWIPLADQYDYLCEQTPEEPKGFCQMEECKNVCNTWWPMEQPCTDATCGRKIFRLRTVDNSRSTVLKTCDQLVQCPGCPLSQAPLPTWAIVLIVIVPILAIVGSVLITRAIVRDQRLRRAMMGAKKEGTATVGVSAAGVTVKEKEEYQYEYSFQGKSAMVTLDDKSARSSIKKAPAGKGAFGKLSSSKSRDVKSRLKRKRRRER